MSNNINLSKEYKNKGAEFYRLKNYDEANKYYDLSLIHI